MSTAEHSSPVPIHSTVHQPIQGAAQVAGQITAQVNIAGEDLVLLPQRAAVWTRRQTLLLADFHWGKEQTFRQASIPIPDGGSDDLLRLDRALACHPVNRLVILGDFFHAKQGRSAQVLRRFLDWRYGHADLEILLIRGNHDRRAGDPPVEWNITTVDAPYQDAPFVYAHDPASDANGYVLAGHLHPGARLVGKGRQEVQLPCFWFGRDVGVLPAFGGFTGLATIQPVARDQVFVVVGQSVLRV